MKRKLIYSAVAFGALISSEQAQAAKRYASVADILTATRCEIARVTKDLISKNYNIGSFDGTMTFKSAYSSTRNASVEASATIDGFIQIAGSDSPSKTFQTSSQDEYNFYLLPKAPIPAICNSDKLWIRFVNDKYQTEKPVQWSVIASYPPAPPLQKGEFGMAERTYNASIETDNKNSASVTISLIIFKVTLGAGSSSGNTETFQFVFKFSDKANPKLSGNRPLPSDKIPVAFGPLAASGK